MKLFDITEKEKIILYGLVKYPRFTDKQLSEKFNIKHSTVTSIRHRLFEEEYYRSLNIPRLQNMGCQMLVATYTNFSPLIPLEERIEITDKTRNIFTNVKKSYNSRCHGFVILTSRGTLCGFTRVTKQ